MKRLILALSLFAATFYAGSVVASCDEAGPEKTELAGILIRANGYPCLSIKTLCRITDNVHEAHCSFGRDYLLSRVPAPAGKSGMEIVVTPMPRDR